MPPRTQNTRASATTKSASDQPGPADSTSATRSTSSQSIPATGINSGTALSKQSPQRKARLAKPLCNNATPNTPEESTPNKSTNPEDNNDDLTNLNTSDDFNRTQNSNDLNSTQELNRTQETTQQTRLGSDKTKPTFDNYRSLMKLWPPGHIKQHLDDNKPSNRTRPSHEIRERVKLIYRVFQHELLMLAMVGELSETTIKSIIPGLNAKKGKGLSCYILFLEYYSDCLAAPMPLKGQDDIEGESMLAERNRKNGIRWQSLTADEKAVFDPTIFYALAGVPNPLCPLESEEGKEVGGDEDNEDERGDSYVPVPKVHKLSVEEDTLYR